MDHDPAGHPARPARFDRTNVAVGAVVTAVLVSLLGAGPIAVIVATPREEGANIGGGVLAIRLYAAERGARPLIGVAMGVCQSTPQWRSSRSR
jgi:hypothetical protein